MKNIKITIIKNKKIMHSYISDIVPLVGDLLEIPETVTANNAMGMTTIHDNPEKGMYMVVDRMFIANNNQVKLSVENLIEHL